MRFLIAGVSGIAGLICLMAVMGGFKPRLQTIMIGLVLLLVAVLVARSRRKEPRIVRVSQGNQGGKGWGQTTARAKEICAGSGRNGSPASGAGPSKGDPMGFGYAVCPSCNRVFPATPGSLLMSEHYPL